jgi:ubiquitin-like-conjugating enzyme ATG10
MAIQDSLSNYPFLTQEEFSLACHFLDQKYITATLGQERRAFKLRLQHSLLSDSVSISITKPIDVSKNGISLSLPLLALSWGEKNVDTGAVMDIDAENSDSVRISIPRIHAKSHVNVTQSS